MPRATLPIDPFLPQIAASVRDRRAAVVVAAPGAGKTTRVPVALAADGPVIVLQPRRMAARSIARRIADEQGWTVGEEVGWQVRFERRFTARTRVLLATEGILTARLQQDPLLSSFRTIVLDEFHERSIHADLGIALARQAWAARPDLRVVVMSATIDAEPIAAFLDRCPIVRVAGAQHPLDIRYQPEMTAAAAAASLVRETPGTILVFLAGAAEIRRARGDCESALRGLDVEIAELHGSLPPAEQDAAIASAARRRVILATNIAETSLTVPGVTAVVDSGLHKVARYDPDRAIDSLETERISRDSADQRAGRAGRTGPGIVVRLWHAADRLVPHREPDIHRIDLSGPLLDVLAWGGTPARFEWFDPPGEQAIVAALTLLERLGAVEDGRPTPLGRRMQQVPLHPRLSRVLLAAGGSRAAALACALLAERHFVPPPARAAETTTSDLLSAVERERELPAHVRRVADSLRAHAGDDHRTKQEREETDDDAFRRAVLAGYPDRVARRRAPGSPRVLLASGHGAVLAAESGVRTADLLVALDVSAGRKGEGSEALIRIASAIEKDWLVPTSAVTEHSVDSSSGTVRAVARTYYDRIVLSERPERSDPDEAGRLVADAYLSRGLSDGDERLIRRLRFAGFEPDVPAIVATAAQGARAVGEVALAAGIEHGVRQQIERLAPEYLVVPSGRRVRLDYEADGTVRASVKLQELFGLADTPRVGRRAEPVLLALLAPNGRPVQMTRDLRSFWDRMYPEVRKELRGRYPRHPWPEDPWTAPPTAKAVRRGSK